MEESRDIVDGTEEEEERYLIYFRILVVDCDDKFCSNCILADEVIVSSFSSRDLSFCKLCTVG